MKITRGNLFPLTLNKKNVGGEMTEPEALANPETFLIFKYMVF